MFSLGIILFELYYPFSSQMERNIKLLKLRNESELPEDFETRVGIDNLDIKDKIKNLVSKDPKDRLRAKDFLNEYQDHEFLQMIRSIANPEHSEFRAMISTLFAGKHTIINKQGKNQQIRSTIFNLYEQIQKEEIQEKMTIKNYLPQVIQFEKILEKVFCLHGGLQFDISSFIIAQNIVHLKKLDNKPLFFQNSGSSNVHFLTQDGVIYEYANNLIQPFILTLNQIPEIKDFRRYSFHDTQILNPSQKFKFSSKRAATFDIISGKEDFNENELRTVQMVELIQISSHILSILKTVNQQQIFVFRISHSQIFSAILRNLKISEEWEIRFYKNEECQKRFKKFKSSTKELDRIDFILFLVQTMDIPFEKANMLAVCTLFSSTDFKQFTDFFQSQLKIIPQSQLNDIINQMKQFYGLIVKFELLNDFIIEFEACQINHNKYYYYGCQFEVMEQECIKKNEPKQIYQCTNIQQLNKYREEQNKVQKKQSVILQNEFRIITGGCYSHYIQGQRMASGIQIYQDSITYSRFLRYLRQKSKFSGRIDQFQLFKVYEASLNLECFSQQLDVLIVSDSSNDLLEVKLKTCMKLWSNNIKAAYIPQRIMGNTSLFVYNHIYQASLLVVLRLNGIDVLIQSQISKIRLKQKLNNSMRRAKLNMTLI